MNALELKINRLNTDRFISERPSEIALTPRRRIETPAGGYKFQDLPARDPQTMRIIEIGMQQTPPIIVTTDGKQRQADFILLGSWDAVVEKDDYWVAEDGRIWTIGDVVRSNQYETRALVAERGK